MERLWLVECRNALNLTQEEVAKRAEIERSTYTKIENGGSLSVNAAKRIGLVLEVPWMRFFEEECESGSQKHSESLHPVPAQDSA